MQEKHKRKREALVQFKSQKKKDYCNLLVDVVGINFLLQLKHNKSVLTFAAHHRPAKKTLVKKLKINWKTKSKTVI